MISLLGTQPNFLSVASILAVGLVLWWLSRDFYVALGGMLSFLASHELTFDSWYALLGPKGFPVGNLLAGFALFLGPWFFFGFLVMLALMVRKGWKPVRSFVLAVLSFNVVLFVWVLIGFPTSPGPLWVWFLEGGVWWSYALCWIAAAIHVRREFWRGFGVPV